MFCLLCYIKHWRFILFGITEQMNCGVGRKYGGGGGEARCGARLGGSGSRGVRTATSHCPGDVEHFHSAEGGRTQPAARGSLETLSGCLRFKNGNFLQLERLTVRRCSLTPGHRSEHFRTLRHSALTLPGQLRGGS